MRNALFALSLLLPACVADIYVPPASDAGPATLGDETQETDSGSQVKIDSGLTPDSATTPDSGVQPMPGWCGVPQGQGVYAKAYCPSFVWVDSQNKTHSCEEPCPNGNVCHVDPNNKNLLGVCQN